MELDRLSASILALAEFHGLCMAYDLCSENNSTLEEKFPVFKNENLMWIQPDMLHFLRNVSQNAQKFLYNLKPQEKALHQRFSKVRYKLLSNSRSPPYSNFVSSVIRVKWISNKKNSIIHFYRDILNCYNNKYSLYANFFRDCLLKVNPCRNPSKMGTSVPIHA